uniref:DUF4806 domain-containing protein n=1 Tax=Panagrellus redivivus TaxID=6233 RepID=A0A7E4W6X0_PANRE
MDTYGFVHVPPGPNTSGSTNIGRQPALYYQSDPITVESLLQRIVALENGHNSLVHHYETASIELADVKSELAETKAELTATKADLAATKAEMQTLKGIEEAANDVSCESDVSEENEETTYIFNADRLTHWKFRTKTFDLDIPDSDQTETKTVDFEQVAQNLGLSGKDYSDVIRPLVKGVISNFGNDESMKAYSLSLNPRHLTSFNKSVVQRTAYAISTACGKRYKSQGAANKHEFFKKCLKDVNSAFKDYFNNLRRKRFKPSPEAIKQST